MLKEIHEQPYAIAETLRGRVEGTDRIILPELDAIHDKFKTSTKLTLLLVELLITLVFQEQTF